MRLPAITILLIFSLAMNSYSQTKTMEPAAINIESIWILNTRGAIGPATSDYIIRGIAQAKAAGANLVILKMDTPGGLDKSMRTIIQAILQSDIPVVTYITPAGARAASAGTYILYASHVAAMTPATNLGAATPVRMGAPSLPGADPKTRPKDETERKEENEQQPSTDAKTTLERKQLNDSIAYIRGLAELHGRNVEWAEQAVRSAESLTASDALERRVIDLVATDLDDLLLQLNGRQVKIKDRYFTLVIDNPQLKELQPDWRNSFLATITDPNIAYILMLIGIYGLILEFYNPGMGLPGITGAICLLIALYAFQVLPVSYTGAGLIILGLALMVAEAFAPSFGVLGIGGVIAFIFGSIILMDTEIPAFQIAMPLIAAFGLLSVFILVVVARLLVKTRQQRTVTGMEAMIGNQVTVAQYDEGQGKVWLNGELWDACGPVSLQPGDRATILQIDGLKLTIKAVDS